MAFRNGYGLGNYSADLYGIDSKLILGAASGADASDGVVFYERVISFSASASSVSGGSAAWHVVGVASGGASSMVHVNWNRLRLFSGTGDGSADVVVLSRYKWLDESAAPVTWADGDYREGAA